MPKIEDDFEDEDELEDEGEDLEEDELEESPKRKPIASKDRGKPPLKSKPIPRVERELKEEETIKRRFGIMEPTPLRVIDMESREVVGEGEYLIVQTLTDIIERLERIENTIGSMLER